MVKGRALSACVRVVSSKPAGQVKRSGKNKAVTNVFAGWTVVSRSEGVIRVANAVHIVEQFAEHAAPGLGLREGVVGGQIEAVRCVALQMKHQSVVAGAIVRAEHHGSRKRIPTIGVIAFLVRVVGAEHPIGVECVLNSAGRVEGVRSFVIWIDQSRGRIRSSVYRLKCGGPAVLSEIVVEQAETRAQHGFSAVAGGICNSQTRCELLAVIVRRAQRKSQRRQERKGWIFRLTAARSGEQAECGLVAQSVVEREMSSYAPGVFRVERETLHVLREASVSGRSEGGIRALRQEAIEEYCGGRLYSRNTADRAGSWYSVSALPAKCAAEHRLMNEVDAELESVVAGGMAYIVAELIFFLIAQIGEKT